MIAPQYIQEGIRIRDTYQYLSDTFDAQLAQLEVYKEEIQHIEQAMDGADTVGMTEEVQQRLLQSTLADMQRATSKMAGVSGPHMEQMEQLRKDARKLYEVLRERYPGMTDAEMATALAAGYAA